MEQMKFGTKWRLWIRGCLESAKASVIINGSPTIEFPMTKGVQQCDPLSPFLFIIAMEGLNMAMKTAVEKGVFEGIRFSNSNICLSHLFYADDALFIGEWSRRNIANLARILRCFHIVSGLKVNFNKCKVFGVGAPSLEVLHWSAPLGCEPSSLPFTYLGIPVGDNMNLKKAWRPIIEKFRSKLSSWKAKSLSFGGRVTLAKAVLGHLPSYFMSIFRVPKGVIDTLEKIRRTFIWSKEYNKKGISWVGWDKIIAPKKVGGIGLGSIYSLNISLLAKWLWRLKSDSSVLWAKVIRGVHNLDERHWSCFASSTSKGVWKNITKIRPLMMKVNIHPKEIVSWNSDSKCWASEFMIDNRFSVSLIRDRFELAGHIVCDRPFDWNKMIPFKILCFIWRAKQGRIPFAVELKSRGIIIPSTVCISCKQEEETSDHMLITCQSVRTVMNEILNWCVIRCDNFNSVKDMLLFISRWSKCKKRRSMLNVILCGALWCIWIDRNNRVFNNFPVVPTNTVEMVKSLSFIWCKHRGPCNNIDWRILNLCP
ncbi:uncharacterized protein LOC111886502 [Lactuca sativa]|uniref:uncharacterized protein LOC111886502 n=1 Tax=Lactuca sativa TaxID=4236 RepID=UPI000CD93B6D|nr:uncharacterized protein LOC111886502 [Lactuca sativa]